MPDEDFQRLRLPDLPALLERAKAERWTVLAIVPWDIPVLSALVERARERGVPWPQIVAVQPVIGDAEAEAVSRLANLTSLEFWRNPIGKEGIRVLLDAWADPATSQNRQRLNLNETGAPD